MKILIVDNDVDTVTTLQALLSTQESFKVDVAYGGQESLEKMAINPDYNVVLLDIMMPKVSGMDVCQAMINDPTLRKIPVLLMSSALPIPPEEFQNSLEKFSDLNVVKGVIEKPFVIENLIEQIYLVARKPL